MDIQVTVAIQEFPVIQVTAEFQDTVEVDTLDIQEVAIQGTAELVGTLGIQVTAE